MKKRLYAGLFAACLFALVIFAPAKFAASSPDEPLSHRSIVLCIAAFIGLHAYKSRTTEDETATAIYKR